MSEKLTLKSLPALLFASLISLFLAHPAMGVDFLWDVDGPANWDVGSSWNPEGPPNGGGGNHAFINNGGVAEITADIADIQDIFVAGKPNADQAETTSGTLNQTGGATFQGTGSWMFVGQYGGTGEYNLSGGTANKERLYIGRGADSHGTLNLSGTGVVGGDLFIAGVEGASATVNVSGGGSFNTTGNVEFHNAPEVSITDDALVKSGNEVWFGNGGGNTTTANMDSGTIEADTWIAIGRDSANGTVNLSGNAEMHKINTGEGQGEGDSTGSFIVVGGLGNNGLGTLNVSENATVLSDTGLVMGETYDGNVSNGIVNQSGGTVTLHDFTPFDFQDNYGASLSLGLVREDGVVSDGSGEYHLSGGVLDAETVDIVNGVFDMTGGTFSATEFKGDFTQGGGTTSPGSSPGTMTVTGNYSLNSGDLYMEIEGTGAGTGYDQLIVTGDVSLAGDLTLAGSYVPGFGDSFTLIDNQGVNAISGMFTGIAEGAMVSFNGIDLTATYLGGDGNDFILFRANIPEPASVTLIGLAFIGVLSFARRRRR